jgi:hypothetical protein
MGNSYASNKAIIDFLQPYGPKIPFLVFLFGPPGGAEISIFSALASGLYGIGLPRITNEHNKINLN